MNADTVTRRIAKPLVFGLCLLPLAWLVAGVLQWPGAELGANPVEKVQDTLGIWGLRLLLLTLVVTPLRETLGWPRLLAFRRMLGLFAFAYIALHFLWYLLVDQAFDWRQLLVDIAKRPYVTIGFAALVLLAPLAWTSTNRAMRRMGRRWQKLHRLVYPAVVLGCVHFWWQVKADVREPVVYAAIAALLLGWRLQRHWRRRAAASRSSGAPPGPGRQGDAGQDQGAARRGAPARFLAEQPPAQ
ncbi:MAG TPA: protein-methionine-sulfoxide reductase heme-binding subunit MsrQ [Steroidobacteraceae bacterium]|nr:protein-methionine-sulfoxide reductase heme-binding subunit MsrQ [Steroidobacteraceae bacterium]